ncbi:hypothetical protein N1030_01275 [Desulfovibrio mangrovi]|uniref:hypothetical protein n=1 Tax=Desulfovibrio mangrovi TaxID=2976983 RepID=UPI00224514E8|nr:hypothetical protein [Desulfovibrio mangrovi]UZP67625.1 hypothetical protein N1030_01275 [Desulfovibrio mangrovi]
MHASGRLLEKLSHDPLMLIFCGVMLVLIVSIGGMQLGIWFMQLKERRQHHGR